MCFGDERATMKGFKIIEIAELGAATCIDSTKIRLPNFLPFIFLFF